VTRAISRVAIVLALGAFAAEARAQARVVVVDDGDRTTRAATERLRGELTAAGFVVVPRPGATDEADGDPESVATVRLVRSTLGRGAELRVFDRLTGKSLVRRVDADPERAPRLVAMRGVELLRASLLELASPPPAHDDVPPATPALAHAPPPEIARFVGAPAAAPEKPLARPPPARWVDHAAFDAGIAILASTDRLGPAAAPKVGVWLALPASFAARVQLVGPAFQSGLANADGTAVVRQELGTIDFAFTPLVGRTLVPLVALGAGPYHLHVQGTPALPGLAPASNDVWAAVFAASVGLGVRIAQGVSVAAEGRALFVAPHPAVTIGGETVGSAGSPSLLASLSLVASF
jgi:hypothetical protein